MLTVVLMLMRETTSLIWSQLTSLPGRGTPNVSGRDTPSVSSEAGAGEDDDGQDSGAGGGAIGGAIGGWRFTGPFQTASLGGPATFERIANDLWPELSSATSLQDLRRWLDENTATATPLRERRDDGLVNELLRDRDRTSEATP